MNRLCRALIVALGGGCVSASSIAACAGGSPEGGAREEAQARPTAGQARAPEASSLPAPPGAPPRDLPPASAPDGEAPDPRTCAGRRPMPVDREIVIRSGGADRTARVHVPESYRPTSRTPLVLVFHAYLSDAPQMILYGGMNAKADEAGFIAVHPQGTANSWNAGACCGEAARGGVDDVGFVRDLLDTLEAELCVDPRRIFATGMSNGGFFSHRLACELSERIAAVAPVAGVLGLGTCTPTRPVSVLQFHGTLDSVVPYGGSDTLGFGSVASTMDGWRRRDGCHGPPREVARTTDVRCEAWDCMEQSEVRLCTVTGGGHTWPGGLPIAGVHTSQSVRAADAAWAFFQAHPLP